MNIPLRKKELTNYLKVTQRSRLELKKHHKNNVLRFTFVLAAGTRCRLVLPLGYSILGLSLEKGKSFGPTMSALKDPANILSVC